MSEENKPEEPTPEGEIDMPVTLDASDIEEASPEFFHKYLAMSDKTHVEANPGLHALMKRIQAKNGSD